MRSCFQSNRRRLADELTLTMNPINITTTTTTTVKLTLADHLKESIESSSVQEFIFRGMESNPKMATAGKHRALERTSAESLKQVTGRTLTVTDFESGLFADVCQKERSYSQLDEVSLWYCYNPGAFHVVWKCLWIEWRKKSSCFSR